MSSPIDRVLWRAATILVIACSVLLITSQAAPASVIAVDTTADLGADPASCNLRTAINAAREDKPLNGCVSGNGDDTIRLPAGVFKITPAGPSDNVENLNQSGDLDFDDDHDLVIEPTDSTVKVAIDGNEARRVFDARGIADGKLTIRNLTISNGRAMSEDGGAIRVNSDFEINGVTFDENRGKSGGAIAVASGSNGLVINSTISGNQATTGGGIFAGASSNVAVRSSTITGNSAADGGGVASSGSAKLSLVNSINGSNTDTSGDASSPDCSTNAMFAARFVVSTQAIGAGDCLTSDLSASNKVVVDLGLLALFDNGGQTRTHAPVAGSPAIAAAGNADPDVCPTVDQRAVVRPANRCDVGSVQVSKDEIIEPPECAVFPTHEGCPLGPIKNPTTTTATFDGKRLQIRLKCPARFKPRCFSKSTPMTLGSNRGVQMATKKVSKIIRSNRWLKVTYLVKPAFRSKVLNMTRSDKKLLHTRQVIRSKRIGSRKNWKVSTIFHSYKVRVQG